GQHASDHNLPLMTWLALEPLAADDSERAVKLALASPIPRTLEFTARRVASTADPAALDILVRAATQVSDQSQTAAILMGMNAALRGQRDIAVPASWERAEPTFWRHASGRVRAEAQTLGLTFGSPAALQWARSTLADTGMPEDRKSTRLNSSHVKISY